MRSRGSSPVSRHGRKKSCPDTSRPKSATAATYAHRPSLIPPDIVLQSEDQETHEPLTTTLVSGKSCNDVITSYEQMRECDRRGSKVSTHSMVSVRGHGFDDKPRETFCWKCNKSIFTVTKRTLKPTGFAFSIICCILCPLFAICVIPVIMRHQNIVIHKCPHCKIRLGSSA